MGGKRPTKRIFLLLLRYSKKCAVKKSSIHMTMKQTYAFRHHKPIFLAATYIQEYISWLCYLFELVNWPLH